MKLLTQNSKLKKTSKEGKTIIDIYKDILKLAKLSDLYKPKPINVYNFGITAVKSCPSALHCVADCYAQQGAYRWSGVKNAYDTRYELTKTKDFPRLLDDEIKSKRNISHVRIHDSGDFYSREYLNKWISIMHNNPDITFYAYTKEVKLFKEYKAIMPSNFIYIFSYGGKWDHLIDKSKDRHAMVYETLNDLPSEYINASDNDLQAITGNINVGLVYHGQSKMKGFKRVLNNIKSEVVNV